MAGLTLEQLEEIAKTRTLTKSERTRKSHLKNIEKRRAQGRARYRANREKIAAQVKRHRLANKERLAKRVAERRLERLARDPNFEREAIRKWREGHPSYNKDYAENNRDIIRAQGRRRRAKEWNAEGSHTQYELDMLMVRQANQCANPYCRVDLRTVPAQVDHRLALSRGGSDYITNIQHLCRPCNARKHDLLESDWLERERKRHEKRLDRTAPQGA